MTFLSRNMRKSQESRRRTDRKIDASPHTAAVFVFLIKVAKDSDSYYVTFVRSCNVALWNISLYLVGWRTCAVIRLHDRHAPTLRLRIIRSHRDGSPIMWPWYYLQRRISTGAKFPTSPHLKLSHRGGCGELAQDPRMQMAVWKRLLRTWSEDCYEALQGCFYGVRSLPKRRVHDSNIRICNIKLLCANKILLSYSQVWEIVWTRLVFMWVWI